MLEGMKVLFDDKVSLYPVQIVAKTPSPSEALRYGV